MVFGRGGEGGLLLGEPLQLKSAAGAPVLRGRRLGQGAHGAARLRPRTGPAPSESATMPARRSRLDRWPLGRGQGAVMNSAARSVRGEAASVNQGAIICDYLSII